MISGHFAKMCRYQTFTQSYYYCIGLAQGGREHSEKGGLGSTRNCRSIWIGVAGMILGCTHFTPWGNVNS